MLHNLSSMITSKGRKAGALTAAAIMSLGLCHTAQAIPLDKISQLYFFGDSLTDSGFNNYLPLVSSSMPNGKAPTFTTYGGFTWSQYLARDIKGFVLPDFESGSYPFPNPPDLITNNTTPLSNPPGVGPVSGTLMGIDYAAGGSTTNSGGFNLQWAPSLHAQIQNFLATAGTPLDPNAVYFIWSGANDFLTTLTTPAIAPQCSQLPPAAAQQCNLLVTADIASTNIANEVALLSRHGAEQVVVMSLPNLGYTPFIRGMNVPGLPASMKTLSFTFNSMLNQKLGQVIASTGVKVLYVNVYGIVDDVIESTIAGKPYMVDGQAFYFTNYTDPACGAVPSAILCPPGTPTGYIFADGLHPTDEAHRALSLAVEQALRRW
ncbi:SGNH/GDSL hydrolase family protein [Legionella sp. CNM-4043-24]|uniref:SGNH/GDSL hydrolase family protein n=1 Tax=Legionella sp. CNM-4043-24 TaxID=3421646 RepID=UPI00403A95ED